MSVDDDSRETRVSVHQPNFLPWTRLFDKVLASDVYVAYDSVQYTHSEFHSRQWITGRDGPVWLSVPVLTRGRRQQPLCAVELVENRAWRDAHLRLITEHYRRAPYFQEVIAVLESVYAGDDVHLTSTYGQRGSTFTGPRWRWPGSPWNPSTLASRATGSSSSRSGRTYPWWTCCSTWARPRQICCASGANSTGYSRPRKTSGLRTVSK